MYDLSSEADASDLQSLEKHIQFTGRECPFNFFTIYPVITSHKIIKLSVDAEARVILSLE